MRENKIIINILFSLCLIFFITTNIVGIIKSKNEDKKILIINTNNNDQRPYHWNKNGIQVGSDVEIVTTLFKRVGYKVKVRVIPFKRLIFEVKFGITFGGFPCFKTKERKKFAIYLNVPLHWSTYSIFVNKGKEFVYNNLKDLYGKRIGKNQGYNLGAEIKKANKKKKLIIEEAVSYRSLIIMLKKNRVDAIIANSEVLKFHMRELKILNDFISLPGPLKKPRPSYIIISKSMKSPNKEILIKKLKKEIFKMHKEGVIDKIKSKYINLFK